MTIEEINTTVLPLIAAYNNKFWFIINLLLLSNQLLY